MRLTKAVVKSMDACTEGYAYFVKNFPSGADYEEVQSKLRADKRTDWAA
jgi:hypothetical protein